MDWRDNRAVERGVLRWRGAPRAVCVEPCPVAVGEGPLASKSTAASGCAESAPSRLEYLRETSDATPSRPSRCRGWHRLRPGRRPDHAARPAHHLHGRGEVGHGCGTRHEPRPAGPRPSRRLARPRPISPWLPLPEPARSGSPFPSNRTRRKVSRWRGTKRAHPEPVRPAAVGHGPGKEARVRAAALCVRLPAGG